MTRTGRTILAGTVVAGTLDLIAVCAFAGLEGHSPLQVLRAIAQGPFGPAMREGGAGGALAGLCVHYLIMVAMVALFVMTARRVPWLRANPVAAGLGYGVLLYVAMDWLVLPLRWPRLYPQLGWWPIAGALIAHCLCVGLPIALVGQRWLGRYSLR